MGLSAVRVGSVALRVVLWVLCASAGSACAAHTKAGKPDSAFDGPPTAAGTLPGGRSPFLNPPAAQCRMGDCNRYGWTTTGDSGTTTAQCIASDCAHRGWTIIGATGSLSTPPCRFTGCEQYGWNTLSSGGSNIMTSCPMADCNKNGWTTVFPDGRMQTCRCRYRNCPKYGADCS